MKIVVNVKNVLSVLKSLRKTQKDVKFVDVANIVQRFVIKTFANVVALIGQRNMKMNMKMNKLNTDTSRL